MKFWKMHGLGNDFAVFDARATPFDATAEWARRVCDRRTGIGCDQLAIVMPPRDPAAHVYIKFLNLDGSEPEASGNGTRCAVILLLPEVASSHFYVQTLNGLLAVDATNPDLLTIDMGLARTDWQEIPLAQALDTLHVPVEVPGFSGVAVCTNMGNPHATFFVDNIDLIDLGGIGSSIEHHHMFPRRINAGFGQMIGRDRMRFIIWERGSGITLACGSATCAAVVGAIRRGLAERRVVVDVALGQLTIEWLENGHVLMAGPVQLVFKGELAADLLPQS